MKKHFAVLILGVLVVGIAVALWLLRDSEGPASSQVAPLTAVQEVKTDHPAAAPTPSGAAQAPVAPVAAGNAPPATAEEKEFQNWVSEEGQQINDRGVDSEQKRKELAAVAKQLTPGKANLLVKIASNASALAGEKIVAAYLLIEAGAAAESQLAALIASPLTYGGKQEPHSEGELRGAQERSMRVMAIEGLATRAESDPSARTALERTIPTIPDPYVRSLAERRLAQIKGK